jgi:hypothetical protein
VSPTNTDPYVANMTSFLGIFGITPTAEGQKGIRSPKSVLRTLGLEALAAFGPMLVLSLVDGLILAGRSMPAPKAPKAAKVAEPVEEPKTAPAPVKPAKPASKCTADFHRFCADALEEGSTYAIDATPSYKLWCDWCAARGLEQGSQKRFGGMMGEKFTRDANNGFPRYLGVRAKLVPGLRIVASN